MSSTHTTPSRLVRLSAAAFFRWCVVPAALVSGPGLALVAQEAATGTVEGRVLNAANGNYLSKAVVSVEGTSLQTLTNDVGEYQLRNVPAGSIKLVVSYTGQANTVLSVDVESGKTTKGDIAMGRATNVKNADGTITLSELVVQSQRFRTGQEIATNEERNSTNIKNVVSADSLGYVPDGNIGEFVKFLPGVDISYGGTYVNDGDATSISVRGFGPENTAVLVDGMPVSSPSPASLTRAIGLDMLSINNASRVEVIKVATPDMANDSPGGAINLVTRSAFEYARPSINVDLTVTGNTMETDLFKKTPGPANKSTFHTLPGARFSIAMPLTRTLGFTASLSSDNKYGPSEAFAAQWRTTNQAINLTPLGGSATAQVSNALGRVDLSNPSLQRATVQEVPWNTYRQSGNVKFDWRPFPSLTINSNLQYSRYTGINVDRRLQFTVGAAQDWGSDYVRGYQYKTTTPTFNPSHSTQMTITSRDKEGDTLSSYLKMAYRKGPWRIDASASRSDSKGQFQDVANGHFSGLDLTLESGRVDFTGITEGVPGTISVWNRAGNVMNYSRLNDWVIDGGTLNAQSGEAFQRDIQDLFNLNVSRSLDFLPFNASLKAGVSRSVKDARKWGRGTGYKARYVGPSLGVSQLIDDYTTRAIYGLAAPQEWASTYKLYDVYKTNPEYFNPDADVSLSIGNYNSQVSQTKSVKEISDSAYAMFESKLFRNRLSLVGGVRQKHSSIEGFQPYVDSKFNYVRLPNGLVYTDSIYINGVKYDGSTGAIAGGATYARDAIVSDAALRSRMTAAGAIIPAKIELAPDGIANGTAANNLTLAKERFRTRTIDTSRKDPATPQLQASIDVTDNLKLKLAWSRETKLQNLEDGTKVGILTGGNSLNINANAVPTSDPGGDGSITISNPGLLPEVTNSWNTELSYFTKTGGKFSVSYFYKIKKNLWEEVDLYNDNPSYATILESFGLNPSEFDNWKLSSTINGSKTATTSGYEGQITQNLSPLGRWARRFDVFATYSHRPNAASDVSATSPKGFIARLPSRDKYTGGVSYSALRYSIQARATYTESGISRSSTLSYTAPGESTASSYQLYNMIPSDLRLNLQFVYRISKRYSSFLSANNITQSHTTRKVSDVATGVMPGYAHYTAQRHNGVGITLGVSGQF